MPRAISDCRGWRAFGVAKLIVDRPGEFYRRVGALFGEDYRDLPIRPYGVSIFLAWELEKVHQFIKDNTEYHLISSFRGSVMLNRFVSHADGWLLGDGDADPNLVKVTSQRFWDEAGGALRTMLQRSSSAKGW
jgi:hypothetical protein